MIARLALNESNINFDTRYMDIHIKKEQLSPWYIAVNPSMTVPTLTDGEHSWTDSRDILNFSAKMASQSWADYDPDISSQIEKIVTAHYELPIEKLTFGKMMLKHYPLRKLFPIMLRRIIKQLKAESQTNPIATQHKIAINQERLAYFTQRNPESKLNERREEVREFLNQLPQSNTLLFGDKPSSADIVTAILFARLKMIGEDDLVNATPAISKWFERMEARPAFVKSDIWLHFKPWRILLKY
jgi:glutathione S-transferase